MRRLQRLSSRFGRSQEGVAAVEFALVLPLMLLIYLGGLEVSQAVAVDRKVTLLTRSIGDLVAQVNSVSTSDLDSIFDAAATVMSPYPSSTAHIVVSSIWTDSKGKTTVDWSAARNGKTLTPGADYTLPAGLAANNSSIVVATVDYDYTPPLAKLITGTLPMSETIYLKPRGTERIARTN